MTGNGGAGGTGGTGGTSRTGRARAVRGSARARPFTRSFRGTRERARRRAAAQHRQGGPRAGRLEGGGAAVGDARAARLPHRLAGRPRVGTAPPT